MSCSQKGRTVYLEKIAPDDRATEAQLMKRYPGATCVFLSPKSFAPDIPIFEDGQEAGDPGGLEAALRAITGQDLGLDFSDRPVVEDIGTLTPELGSLGSEPEHFRPIEAAPEYLPQTADWVRLSLYRTASIADALADWSRLTREESVFRYLTPAVEKMPDGYVMLSAGPVTDANRDVVCLAASAANMECLPGMERSAIAETGPIAMDGARYLAFAFPGAITTSLSADDCPAVPAFALDDTNIPADRVAGLSCWRTPFSADLIYPKYVPNPDSERASGIPLPRPRPNHIAHRE